VLFDFFHPIDRLLRVFGYQCHTLGLIHLPRPDGIIFRNRDDQTSNYEHSELVVDMMRGSAPEAQHSSRVRILKCDDNSFA